MADLPDAHTLTELLAGSFQAEEDRLRWDHSETGLDALDEQELVRRVVGALGRQYSVLRSPPLPSSDVKTRSGRPADVVLTPRGRPVWPPGGPDLFTPPEACPPEEAWWLMVRQMWRQPPVGTVQTPAAADVRRFCRLTDDPHIHHAAVVTLAFLSDAEELPHVLLTVDGMLLTPGQKWHFEPEDRHVRVVHLTDRRGHRALVVGVWPVRLWRAFGQL